MNFLFPYVEFKIRNLIDCFGSYCNLCFGLWSQSHRQNSQRGIFNLDEGSIEALNMLLLHNLDASKRLKKINQLLRFKRRSILKRKSTLTQSSLQKSKLDPKLKGIAAKSPHLCTYTLNHEPSLHLVSYFFLLYIPTRYKLYMIISVSLLIYNIYIIFLTIFLIVQWNLIL